MKNLPQPIRQYLPTDFSPADPQAVLKAFHKLKEQISACTNPLQLKNWIAELSELLSLLAEEGSRRYIAMTCNTGDPQIADDYEQFVSQIEPIVAEQNDQMSRLLMNHPDQKSLTEPFGLWFKKIEVALQLFQPENISLQTELSLEIQKYQKITGAMTVHFDGSEQTLPQMMKYQQQTDRSVREAAWRSVWQRRLQDQQDLDTAFDNMLRLRHAIAENSGYGHHYLDYIFLAKERFDYTAKDCQQFHQTIETEVVPRLRRMQEKRRSRLGLETLRPWDLSCDPLGRPPLRPFSQSSELLSKCQKIFRQVDHQFGDWFDDLVQYDLIDADSRMGKAPGGYQISLDFTGKPFIFMNASGLDGDVYTLLHEAGHSFHQFSMNHQPIIAYRDPAAEFAEVASMSMELIAGDYLDTFYSPADKIRSRIAHLEDIVGLFPWVAQIDAFQHELYQKPGHTAAERKDIWKALHNRFEGAVDWTGLETERDYGWQRQLHLFEVPFYYVEYGIAQLGALQLWKNYRADPVHTLQQMKAAYALGSSQGLPTLFETAGLRFDFSAATLAPLMDMVEKELNKLEVAEKEF